MRSMQHEVDATARTRDEKADALARELAQATGLDVSRTGWENLMVTVKGVDPARPASPYLLITVPNDCGHPTDEHGSFPWGVCVGAYSEDGEQDENATNPVLLIDGSEALRLGTEVVKTRIVDTLKAWKGRRAIQAAHVLAEQLAERTGLHCVAEFTLAGTGSVNAYLHHPDAEDERHLQLTTSTGPHPPVDERGAYPDGAAIFEVDAYGNPYPHPDAPPLLSLSPEDTADADADAVRDALVGHLRDWATRRTVEKATGQLADPAPALPFDRMGGVVVSEQLALAWGRERTGAAGPVRWIVALVRREGGEVLDVVADADDPSMLATLVPVAAASVVRIKFPKPVAY